MTTELTLTAGDVSAPLILTEGPFTDQLLEVLPVESRVSRWGQEIYFPLPMDVTVRGSLTRKVDVGDVAYWPEGNSLAVFFGPTPLSEGDQPVPADDVLRVGTVSGSLDPLEDVEAGTPVTLSRDSTAPGR